MSIQLELRFAGRPVYRGHDHYWSVIRDLGKRGWFTKQEILERCNDSKDKCLMDFMRRLIKAGYVRVVKTTFVPTPGKRQLKRDVYELLKRPALTPILNRDGSAGTQGLGQLNMWTAMKALPQFDNKELAAVASTEDVNVTVAAAGEYARHLCRAGYLQIVSKPKPGAGCIYRLRKSLYTGPKPPMILRTKLVYDQNRGEVIGPVIAEEAA